MSAARLVAVAACALVLGAPAARAEEEKASRLRLSPAGTHSIRFVQTQAGSACRVEVLKGGEPHWTLEKCVGTPDDLYYLADSGERFWVVYTIPEKGRAPGAPKGSRKPKRSKYPGWTYAVVAAQYDREGQVVRRVWLNEILKTANELGHVRQMTKHFKWLAGVAGVPGKPPSMDDSGVVVVETVGQKTFKLGFEE